MWIIANGEKQSTIIDTDFGFMAVVEMQLNLTFHQASRRHPQGYVRLCSSGFCTTENLAAIKPEISVNYKPWPRKPEPIFIEQ